jgi:hypothetical protein
MGYRAWWVQSWRWYLPPLEIRMTANPERYWSRSSSVSRGCFKVHVQHQNTTWYVNTFFEFWVDFMVEAWENSRRKQTRPSEMWLAESEQPVGFLDISAPGCSWHVEPGNQAVCTG